MIPLNKPFINNSNSTTDINTFVTSLFPNKLYQITFSARQGLSEVYKQIKLERGTQNIAVSPLTCVEAIYPIIEHGHDIHFIDIDPETLNMDETKIPINFDIVQAIHFGGNPQDMELIKKSNPNIIIEDCAQGFGSFYKDSHVGLFSDYAVFSFMKNFYSLGGGLLISTKKLTEAIKDYNEFSAVLTLYRNFKRTLETNCTYKKNLSYYLLKSVLKIKPDNTTPIINKSKVNNKITSSIQKQLFNYQRIIQNRISNASYILNNLSTNELVPQRINPKAKSNYLRLFFKTKNTNTKEIISFLRSFGIGANHLSQNFLNPYQERFDKNDYLKKFIDPDKLPNYFNLHDRIVSIPISPSVSNNELDYIIDVVNKI